MRILPNLCDATSVVAFFGSGLSLVEAGANCASRATGIPSRNCSSIHIAVLLWKVDDYLLVLPSAQVRLLL